MKHSPDNQARIFISYAREDSTRVKALHQRLKEAGFDPWLDREHLFPGQQWEPVLKRELKRSDFVLVCLSEISINKRGFLQREIKQALEQAQDWLEDDVYLIPARLDDCVVPDILEHLQWVDLFEDYGWEELLRAFEYGLEKRGKRVPQPSPAQPLQQQPPQQPVPKPPVPAAPPRPEPKIVLPVEPPPVLPNGVTEFQFTTRTLDARGQEVKRSPRRTWQLAEDLGDGVTLEMVSVPGGEFEMGSPENETERSKSEVQHRVRLSPFWMSKYQVTQAQWRLVMGKLPEIDEKFRGVRRPVSNVSWDDATAFCQRLSEHSGRDYRLPTEAEWEYACRAGTTTPFAFGPTITPEVVNYDGNHPYGQAPKGLYREQTVDVGSLGVANAFGLYDMHGNVWEWCRDWYGADYYEACRKQGTVVDPAGPSKGQWRVLRGGSWFDPSGLCRSATRFFNVARSFNNLVGVRVVVPARTG